MSGYTVSEEAYLQLRADLARANEALALEQRLHTETRDKTSRNLVRVTEDRDTARKDLYECGGLLHLAKAGAERAQRELAETKAALEAAERREEILTAEWHKALHNGDLERAAVDRLREGSRER